MTRWWMGGRGVSSHAFEGRGRHPLQSPHGLMVVSPLPYISTTTKQQLPHCFLLQAKKLLFISFLCSTAKQVFAHFCFQFAEMPFRKLVAAATKDKRYKLPLKLFIWHWIQYFVVSWNLNILFFGLFGRTHFFLYLLLWYMCTDRNKM